MSYTTKNFSISLLDNPNDAKAVSEFLLSEYSFDDQNHTLGELAHFRSYPFKALTEKNLKLWIAKNENGNIIGSISVFENDHRTGGYLFDYIAVDNRYRNLGIGSCLLDVMENYVKENTGRFILTYTCDLPEYAKIQRLFHMKGYERVGNIPDYYFEGESLIMYYKKIVLD